METLWLIADPDQVLFTRHLAELITQARASRNNMLNKAGPGGGQLIDDH